MSDPVQPKKWRFIQLTGERKQLDLDGYSAPHGRQRKQAIMRDKVVLRQNTVYYAGNTKPTRHIFGVKYEPWELTGRFSDREGGAGYARTKTDEVKKFFMDQAPVLIIWGDILSATGIISEFDPGREAEFEVEWKMTVLIDEDELAPPPPQDLTLPQLPSLFGVILSLQAGLLKIPSLDSLKPSFLESLENAVASVNSAIANVTRAVNSIQSFETAILGDLKRLRAGIGQLRTAVINLQNLVSSTRNDLILIRRSAEADIGFLAQKSSVDVDVIRALAVMRTIDRRAEIAERGRMGSSYVAQLGDTWESISSKLLGSADYAQKIRDLNGVRYGTRPEPGRSYKIPVP